MKLIEYTQFLSAYGDAPIEDLDASFFEKPFEAWESAQKKVCAYIRKRANTLGTEILSAVEKVLNSVVFKEKLAEILSADVKGHRRLTEQAGCTIDIHNRAGKNEVCATIDGMDYLTLVIKE